MIEDNELREVFKIASDEHLQKLDDGFLYLEKNSDDADKLEEMLREAHSLKGDAGMLGVKDVSTLAHQLEHILNAVKRGEQTFSRSVSDRLFHGLNAIRKLVQEATTGEPSGINTFHVLAVLMGSQEEKEAEAVGTQEASAKVSPVTTENTATDTPTVIPLEKTTEANTQAVTVITSTNPPEETIDQVTHTEIQTDSSVVTIEEKVSTVAPNSQSTVPTNKPAVTPTYRIETIRVATRNLDTLMTQAGELTVTKIRLAHRLSEIEEITSIWEEWSRDIFKNRFVIHDINANNGQISENESLGQLQNYHRRAEERLEKLGGLINRLRNAIYEDTARLDIITDEIEEGIRTLRLLPLSTIFNLFPRMVRDLARQENKEVDLIIQGGDTKADKRIVEEMKDPLMHMIRNSIDHGIETPAERQAMGKPPQATIILRGYQTATNVIIEVVDDGRGLDVEKIKQTAIKRNVCTEEELSSLTNGQIQSLIFAPGFSTRTFVTEVSGRGVGLDVVRTNVEALKGMIQVDSTPKKGCTFRVQLGTSLATAHVLIVIVNHVSYAIPLEFVQTTKLVAMYEVFTIEGKDTIIWNNQPVSVARLANLLELDYEQPALSDDHQLVPCIILKVGEDTLGLFVDELIDEQDVVLKPQSRLLKRVRNVAGATILGTGEVCMVLNPHDLIKSVRKLIGSFTGSMITHQDFSNGDIGHTETGHRKTTILLAEDSIATRTQEKRILEAAGYEVVTCVDGLDAFNKLRVGAFDAVVSDIQMPNMDGLTLTSKIRENKEYNELPIILVTSLASEEDKKRGAEAGANAYITKGNFNQEVLLDTLRRLV